jgi:hypothetical protein
LHWLQNANRFSSSKWVNRDTDFMSFNEEPRKNYRTTFEEDAGLATSMIETSAGQRGGLELWRPGSIWKLRFKRAEQPST